MRLVIEPGLASANYWRDLWRYRELFYVLAWRDLAVRYKQTAIGVAWALIRPALTMVVFVLFRRLMGVERGGPPDAVVVFAAVLPWQLFAASVQEAASSLVGSSNLLSKVYFPRLVIPVAAIVTTFVDFLIGLALLAVLMLWYGVAPGISLLVLPLYAALALAISFGVGIFLAAMNVTYRDFRYVVPFLIQVGLFVSPIAFTTATVPERWRPLYLLNPLVGVIDGFRWAILGTPAPGLMQSTAVATALTVVVVVIGIWTFRRMERSFADVI